MGSVLPWKVSRMAGQSAGLSPVQVTLACPGQAALPFSALEHTNLCCPQQESALGPQCPGVWGRGAGVVWGLRAGGSIPPVLGQGYQLFLAIDGIDAVLAEEATGGLFFQIITFRAELSPFHINPDK